jgi:acetyl esterase/lipase
MLSVLLFASLALPAAAQQLTPPEREIPLYSGVAPGSENWNWSERVALTPNGVPMVQNVVRPVLQYYPANKDTAVGTAMIVAPGGGFRNLMMTYEGVEIAKRLNDAGVDAFILKYRLLYTDPNAAPGAGRRAGGGSGRGAGPGIGQADTPQAGQNLRDLGGADGQQAVRVLRRQASEFGIRPGRIGMIGFSAGGTVTLATVFGPADGRPDFAIPIYAYMASVPEPPAGAPPLFIAVAADDQTVGWQNSVELFSSWRKADIPVELHVFQTGLHGFSKKGGGADHFMDRVEEWMRLNGWLSRPAD